MSEATTASDIFPSASSLPTNARIACRTCVCNKFLPFQGFPTERRIEIWKHTLPLGHLHEARLPQTVLKSDYSIISSFAEHECGSDVTLPKHRFSTQTEAARPLVLILACKESHHVYLEATKGVLPRTLIRTTMVQWPGTTVSSSEPAGLHVPAPIRFNPEQDHIYFPGFDIIRGGSQLSPATSACLRAANQTRDHMPLARL